MSWNARAECSTPALPRIDARFEAHVKGTGAIFTRLNRPVRILSKATMATKGEALRAEYAFKQVSRADKLRWCATGLERFVATTDELEKRTIAATQLSHKLPRQPGTK
jgi:predicted GIY-YIG superfamily endonuclease